MHKVEVEALHQLFAAGGGIQPVGYVIIAILVLLLGAALAGYIYYEVSPLHHCTIAAPSLHRH